jgi:hypothetical protein
MRYPFSPLRHHAALETALYFNTLYIEINEKIRTSERAVRERLYPRKHQCSMEALLAENAP